MNTLTIDACGLACPEPVIKVKKALAQDYQQLIVLVDNKIAVENISRFASNKGHAFAVEQGNDIFTITITV